MKDDAYQTMDAWLTPNSQKPIEPYIGMRMKTGKKFNKTHELVYRAYKWDKTLVDDEMILLAWIWERYEGWDEDYKLIINLKKVTHPETLSRRRRELHEAGLIEYSPKALKKREEAFSNERDKASPTPPQIKGIINLETGIREDITYYPTSPTVKIVKGEKVVYQPVGNYCVQKKTHESTECILRQYEQRSLL